MLKRAAAEINLRPIKFPIIGEYKVDHPILLKGSWTYSFFVDNLY